MKPLHALAAAAALLAAPPPADATDSFTVLYAFHGGSDGTNPDAGLTADGKGNLYGTTLNGGGPGCHGTGCGTVFRLAPDGTETVLHAFTGGSDGISPLGGVVLDRKGNLYGTTNFGGATGYGTVFRVAPNGAETVLHSFCGKPGCSDGASPAAGLILDKQGNLYGTTFNGGTGMGCAEGCGSVFRFAPDGTETVLHSFVGGSDGIYPDAVLMADKAGNLYGTTYEGGTQGYGIVFRLATDGTETVLYTFCSVARCVDGASPVAGLIADAKGNLYGTTYGGGTIGDGNVFRLAPDGTETSLYSFCTKTHCADGLWPLAGLVADAQGNLYGTTGSGGAGNCGCGVVFRLAPDGTETVLHAFEAKTGSDPWAGLIADRNGALRSTAHDGGANGDGVVFTLKP